MRKKQELTEDEKVGVLFRKYIAEEENITEEEAADKIKESISVGMGFREPLEKLLVEFDRVFEDHGPIKYVVALESFIQTLLISRLNKEGQEKILKRLLERLDDTNDRMQQFRKSIEKLDINKRMQEFGKSVEK